MSGVGLLFLDTSLATKQLLGAVEKFTQIRLNLYQSNSYHCIINVWMGKKKYC